MRLLLLGANSQLGTALNHLLQTQGVDFQALLRDGLGPIITRAGANLPRAMWQIDRALRPLVGRVQRDLWAGPG